MNKSLIIAVIMVVAVGGVLFLGMNRSAEPAPLSENAGELPAVVVAPNEPGVGLELEVEAEASAGASPSEAITRSFTMKGNNFEFDQREIRVRRGENVRIAFENTGGMHDWRLEGYGVGTQVLASGASETIEFTADRAGQFEYYCSVGRHREMGMKGVLVVE